MQTNSDMAPEGLIKHRPCKDFLPIRGLRLLKSFLIPTLISGLGIFASTSPQLADGDLDKLTTLSLLRMGVYAMIIIVGVVMPIVCALLEYFHTYWFLSDKEIIFYKGAIARVVTRMPYEKIHSITTSEKLLERLSGTMTLTIESAGGNKSNDISIPAIRIEEAESLKADIELYRRGKTLPEMAEATAIDKPNQQAATDISGSNTRTSKSAAIGKNWGILSKDGRAIYAERLTNAIKLTPKEIIIAGLANGRSLLYLLIAIGAGYQVLNAMNLEELILERGEVYVDRLLAYGVPIIIGLVVGAIMISWLVSIIAFVLRNYNFQITKGDGHLEIARGLISRLTVQINPRRIQELRIKQDIISRLFGYATVELRLAVSKLQDGKQKSHEDPSKVILHPLIKLKDLDEFLGQFMTDYETRPSVFTPLPQPALRRSILRHLRLALGLAIIMAIQLSIWNILGIIPTLLPLIFALTLIVLTIVLAIAGYFAYKNAGLTITNRFIAISRGAFLRQYIYIPQRKAQITTLSQNPFQRRHGLFTLTVNTIGSSAYLYDVGGGD